MIKAGVINKYSQVCKKKEKTTKKKNGFVLFPPPQGIPKLFINNWFPSCISAKTAGNRRDGTKRLSWNKKGLRHGQFCSFQCFKIWSDCLNFKHWSILLVQVVHYLFLPWNLPWIILACYGNQQKKKKKKKQSIIPRSDGVVCDIWSGRTRFGNSFIESGTDKPCWSKQKRRGRKRVRSSSALFYHSQ